MMGKHHVIVNSAIVISTSIVCEYNIDCMYHFPNIPSLLHQYFYGNYSDSIFRPWSIVLFVMMLFGTLLPDIDNKTSMLGRYLYIPVKHRTWTHSIWALLLLFGLSCISPIFGAVFVGYGLHLLMDSVSSADGFGFICGYLFVLSDSKLQVLPKWSICSEKP